MPEAPMTPPMSPGHSEEGCMEDSIIVDSEPRFSGPAQPPMASSLGQTQQESRSSSNEEMDGLKLASSPKPPLRLLEDEQVHVEKSGSLRLKDFEIKGTLGQSAHSVQLVEGLTERVGD
jgi:protein kinase A